MHMGIPVCERAGIAKKFAYGDPRTHNEIVRIWGLTYTLKSLPTYIAFYLCICNLLFVAQKKFHSEGLFVQQIEI